MAVALRDRSHADSGGNNVTSIVGNIPATVAAGDFLIAFVGFIGRPELLDPAPAGWTDTGLDQTRFNVVSGKVFTRRATASDAGTNVTFTTADARAMAVDVRAYSGVGNTPFDVAGSGVNGSGTAPTAPSLTTLTDAAMSVVFYPLASQQVPGVLVNITGPAGYGNVENHPQLGDDRLTTYTGDKLLGPAGATGTVTSSVDVNSHWNAFHIALRPGSTNGPVWSRFDGTNWIPQTVTIL